MTSQLAAHGLIALLFASVGHAAGPGSMRSSSASERQAERPTARGEDRPERRRPGYRRWTASPPPQADDGHAADCRCRGCGGPVFVFVEGPQRGGDTIVVVNGDDGRRRSRGEPAVVLLSGNGSGRSDRYGRNPAQSLLDHVSVRRERTDGALALSDSGGDALYRGGTGRADGGRWSLFDGAGRLREDCKAPGTVVASSGALYVRVRADGRLEIRSR